MHVDVWDGPGQMGFGLEKIGCGFLGKDLTPDELTERPSVSGSSAQNATIRLGWVRRVSNCGSLYAQMQEG